ncbi:MAG TPA: GerMN domain-containing protein [Vicinamibacterales bacterium]|jgi:spore germination protein GerM|nr:GerMN domain-containing protein [Vicinamibacterales bacterium]
MSRRLAAAFAIAAVAIAGAWILFVALPRSYAPKPVVQATAAPPPPVAERKITATLYFVSEDGLALVGVQREVPFGEQMLDQARQIVEAQLKDAPPPLASAIPPGTTLRALYITDRGEAFVDLSGDARTKHPGGAIDEIFTVYTIVNAITVNLPAIQRVQILVDGKEVDTLAGHVDLRHPLQKNLKWIKTDKEPS